MEKELISNEELRKELLAVLDKKENMYPELDGVTNWMDAAEAKLNKALSESINYWPAEQESGVGEALNIVLARFVCKILERIQRGGMVADGKTAYGIFMEVIMPTAHKMVCRELDAEYEQDTEEETQRIIAIARELQDRSNDIDDIITRHWPDIDDNTRAKLRNDLAGFREKMKEKGKED